MTVTDSLIQCDAATESTTSTIETKDNTKESNDTFDEYSIDNNGNDNNTKMMQKNKKKKKKQTRVSFSRCTPSQEKAVRFSEEEQVHNVIRRRSQISRLSMDGIWFDAEDFDSFLDEIEKSVGKMEQGKRLKDKKYSSTGLENLTEEGSALRQELQEDAWDAVLWEQHYQYEEGKRSSLQIAQAYREVSRDAESKAMELARSLHLDVCDYLDEATSRDDGTDTDADQSTSLPNDLRENEQEQQQEEQ